MRSAREGQTLSFQVPFCFMRTDASKAQEDGEVQEVAPGLRRWSWTQSEGVLVTRNQPVTKHCQDL